MEISWERVLTALGIAIGGIGGAIPIFNAVAAQWNARKARKSEERGQGLEERKYDDSQWKELAAVRKVDIEEARARIILLEQSLDAEKKRNDDLTDHIEALFDQMQDAMAHLHVEAIPNKVVKIIKAKIDQVNGFIEDARRKVKNER